MLLIVYGGIAEMGLKSREHLIKSGFRFVEKYNYSSAPLLTTQHGKRNYVSEQVFLENTDSLFRYEVGGIKIGFNRSQISDAVCDKTDCLLTLSTDDVSFLAGMREIKRVYADNVRLVYVYIDDTTLNEIVGNMNGISENEACIRLGMGNEIKSIYLKYRSLFDYVVMYGGERSVFDIQSLYKQYDDIIEQIFHKKKRTVSYSDVFISCERKYKSLGDSIRKHLNEKGISVFDETSIEIGDNWLESISCAIQNAKILIPVVTDSSFKSEYVKRETELILDVAEKNGTLILPVINGDVRFPDHMSQMELLNCILVEGGNEDACAEALTNKIYKLFSAESSLKTYSKQVENCMFLYMYERAKYWQEMHLDLCKDVYEESNGAFVDNNTCLLSQLKLIDILIRMQLYTEALDKCIDGLNGMPEDDLLYDYIKRFAFCCVCVGYDETDVVRLAKERLCELSAPYQTPIGNSSDRYIRSYVEMIVEAFENAVKEQSEQKKQKSSIHGVYDKNQEKIADYGKAAIALFEELMNGKNGALSNADLVVGYERILNYCKYVGLNGEIADKCIERIASLTSCTLEDHPQESTQSQALKIYLGQTLPNSGEYDVFISYKSEDEALAKKVYDHLTQSGKVVFFAKETLPSIGNDDYRTPIFEAIDRSKHMVLVSSNADHLKTKWVKKEWDAFDNEITEGRKSGNIILVLSDDAAINKGALPLELRSREIVKMSEFRSRLMSFLR